MCNDWGKAICYFMLIAGIYIGLPILILVGVLPFDSKFYILTLGAAIVYFLARVLGISNAEMGITKYNCRKSIMAVLPITIFLALTGVALWALGFSRINPNETWKFYIFYIFISSPVQEFLYRGAIIGIISNMNFGYYVQLIVSSVLYSFVHIIYQDLITLCLTLIMGVIWFINYKKSNNIFGVSISHAVLGVVTIIAGIID
ncbi:MAG: CPBP family intramembrane metalloprotease [Bacillota bacterium]|nr:CPBP family intramembrane metalloprotease [Bacillota bacterium]